MQLFEFGYAIAWRMYLLIGSHLSHASCARFKRDQKLEGVMYHSRESYVVESKESQAKRRLDKRRVMAGTFCRDGEFQ